MKILTPLVLIKFLFLNSWLMAATQSDHISLHVSKTSIAPKKFQLEWTLKPSKDLEVNFEAPWKIEILADKRLTFSGSPKIETLESQIKVTYDKKDFTTKPMGLTIQLEAKENILSSSKLHFSLDTYTCTSDKKRCYRDVLKDDIDLP